MSDLDSVEELYQQVILDHNRTPRNFRKLEDADRSAEGHNPLCGDHLWVFVRMEGNRIGDITFYGAGCAISKASASMMTEAVKGKSRQEAEELFERFRRLVMGGDGGSLGKLAAFSGVSEFPVRVKCATLAWHTLRSALEGKEETVSTE